MYLSGNKIWSGQNSIHRIMWEAFILIFGKDALQNNNTKRKKRKVKHFGYMTSFIYLLFAGQLHMSEKQTGLNSAVQDLNKKKELHKWVKFQIRKGTILP